MSDKLIDILKITDTDPNPLQTNQLKNKAMKVENMISPRGNSIPNQLILTSDSKREFQSYDSKIVSIDFESGKVTLDRKYWNHSNTTSKYRNIFLNESSKETESKILSGEYKLSNLN